MKSANYMTFLQAKEVVLFKLSYKLTNYSELYDSCAKKKGVYDSIVI